MTTIRQTLVVVLEVSARQTLVWPRAPATLFRTFRIAYLTFCDCKKKKKCTVNGHES